MWHSDHAEDALKKLQAVTLDIILMDINIEGAISGIELSKAMNEVYMDVSNIFLTSIYDEFTFIATVDLKSFDYLIKLPANQDSEEH